MVSREYIIAESFKLLMSIGPSSMTMDMVARTCGISKRTLYEHFPDKRTLIDECLEDDHRRQNEQMKQIFDEAPNCFYALFQVYTRIRAYFGATSMAFIADIRRLYPDLLARHQQQDHQVVEGLSEVLTKAQAEGHVIPTINTKIAAFLFLSTMRNLHESERIREFGFNQIEVFDGAFLNFMRGIATIRGIEYLDSQVGKMKENNLN